jgi:hypothetical protein
MALLIRKRYEQLRDKGARKAEVQQERHCLAAIAAK